MSGAVRHIQRHQVLVKRIVKSLVNDTHVGRTDALCTPFQGTKRDNKYRGGTSVATTSVSLIMMSFDDFYSRKRAYRKYRVTDKRTDGHDLLQRCVVAEKIASNLREKLPTLRVR